MRRRLERIVRRHARPENHLAPRIRRGTVHGHGTSEADLFVSEAGPILSEAVLFVSEAELTLSEAVVSMAPRTYRSVEPRTPVPKCLLFPAGSCVFMVTASSISSDV